MPSAAPKQYEVLAPVVRVDQHTGSAEIDLMTTQGVIQLLLGADVLLHLQDRIGKTLAQAHYGGLRMLPVVVGCHGLEASIGRSQLQIRLVLEDGSEARLPIQESALAKLNAVLTGWFSEQEDQEEND